MLEDPAEYVRGHLRGAVNVRLEGRFAESAGQVFPPDRDIVLVGDSGISQESKILLARVGLGVVGQLENLASVFTQHPDLVETAARFTPVQLAELLNDEPGLQVVEVRSPGETEDGVVRGRKRSTADADRFVRKPGPHSACGHVLRQRLPLAGGRECASCRGFEGVGDLLGGYGAWEESGAT